MKKKLLIAFIIVLLVSCCVLSACSNNETPQETTPRTVIDMKGTEVTLPNSVSRYLVLWKCHTGVLAMLDSCEGLVGCDYSVNKSGDAWLFELCPHAKDIVVVGEDITSEEVVALNVDVVFWQSNACAELASQLIELGIAAVNVDYTDYSSMKKSVTLTADVLGTEKAKSKATQFNAYLDKTISDVQSITANIKEEDKVTVLNLRKFSTLRADGKDTVADVWINMCGGINVVSQADLKGNQYLTAEQVLAWDPDFIVSSNLGDDAAIAADDVYKELSAVKNNNVYVNPQGMFWWNRYCIETILQLKWALTKMYPSLSTEINMETETKSFYKQFFNYDLSDKDVANILSALPPENYSK